VSRGFAVLVQAYNILLRRPFVRVRWSRRSSCMTLSVPVPRSPEPVVQRCTPMATAARSSVLCVLGMALATGVSCSCPDAPSITSISPSGATAAGSQFVLTINGNHFLSDSMVDFNGFPLTATFVNSHQLTATIPAADIAQPATLQVLVLNPPEGGTSSSTIGGTPTTTPRCSGSDSNAVSFTVSP
jgi:hypothetical protein